ncbi:putative RNA polymerase inhibitor [Vibrio phage VP3]|uniref:Putative RNA polymerase inhibitor n=1 Tax=Vibrio phage VP3 TaxID=588068 RepID=H9YAF8_9CAUD|nr:putative RNA polymerase inhibitor [Vibrio phage VP3]
MEVTNVIKLRAVKITNRRASLILLVPNHELHEYDSLCNLDSHKLLQPIRQLGQYPQRIPELPSQCPPIECGRYTSCYAIEPPNLVLSYSQG